MTTDQTTATITCACCGGTVTGSLCCPKPPGSAWGAKCPEHAPDHRAEAERMIAARPAVAEVHALLSIDARLARLDDTLRTILCWEEPPEEVLARVKEQTLEKAAEEESRRKYEDMIHRPESITVRGGDSHIHFGYAVHNPQNPLHAGQNRPRSDVQPSEASQGTPTATDAPEPAQTLADLTPCLGDRVRARGTRHGAIEDFTYGHHPIGGFGWSAWVGQSVVTDAWAVLEHLPPVTPEEPPVGAGMLVDDEGDLWRRGYDEWMCWVAGGDEWCPDQAGWLDIVGAFGPLRPATPADLARHGVDEQGEPVGKGEQVTITMRPGWRHSTAEHWRTEASILRDLRPETTAAAALCDALADALDGAR